MNFSPSSQTVTTPDRSIQIEWDSSPTCDEWDSFVESFPDGHHEQTSLWGEVRSLYGWRVGRIVCREHGRIVAGVQLQVRPLGRLGCWGYVTYGPCVGAEDPLLNDAVVSELKRRARFLGLLFIVVGLPYHAHHLVPHLTVAGFHHKPWRFPPKFIEATCVIDLAQEPDRLLARMRRNTRKNIRHALKEGIRVVEGSGKDLAVFHRLMLALCQRRGTSPNPAQPDFFTNLWRRFQPKGWIRLFFAMNGDEPVSASIAFTFQGWFRSWKVGWSGRHGNLRPNEALQWEMIQWARQRGLRYFDFVSMDADAARVIVEGGVTHNMPENETSYKLGFGGDIKLLPGAYYYMINPVVRTLLRCGVASLLHSPVIWKLATASRNLKTRLRHA